MAQGFWISNLSYPPIFKNYNVVSKFDTVYAMGNNDNRYNAAKFLNSILNNVRHVYIKLVFEKCYLFYLLRVFL